MAVSFEVTYLKIVVQEDIPHLGNSWRERVRKAIEDKLTTTPDFFGKPLRRSLKGYRKLRVGDYRVVFRIQGNQVVILAILHRSVVYSETEKRSKR